MHADLSALPCVLVRLTQNLFKLDLAINLRKQCMVLANTYVVPRQVYPPSLPHDDRPSKHILQASRQIQSVNDSIVLKSKLLVKLFDNCTACTCVSAYGLVDASGARHR